MAELVVDLEAARLVFFPFGDAAFLAALEGEVVVRSVMSRTMI